MIDVTHTITKHDMAWHKTWHGMAYDHNTSWKASFKKRGDL